MSNDKTGNESVALYHFLYRKHVRTPQDAKMFDLWWKAKIKKIDIK